MTATETKIARTGTGKTVALSTTSAKIATKPAVPKTVAKKVTSAVKAKPVAKKTASATKLPVKPAVKAVIEPTTKPVVKLAAEKPAKVKKPKLVRDSFTIPKAEYTVLDELKQRAGKLATAAKKSELLRAGVKALAAMPDAAFLAALKAVPTIKTGRPSKE